MDRLEERRFFEASFCAENPVVGRANEASSCGSEKPDKTGPAFRSGWLLISRVFQCLFWILCISSSLYSLWRVQILDAEVRQLKGLLRIPDVLQVSQYSEIFSKDFFFKFMDLELMTFV
jgi:hypothetical protein